MNLFIPFWLGGRDMNSINNTFLHFWHVRYDPLLYLLWINIRSCRSVCDTLLFFNGTCGPDGVYDGNMASSIGPQNVDIWDMGWLLKGMSKFKNEGGSQHSTGVLTTWKRFSLFPLKLHFSRLIGMSVKVIFLLTADEMIFGDIFFLTRT